MSRWLRISLALLVLASLPAAARAQFSVAPRIGTLGLGVDVGLELAPVAVARAGFGFVPVEPRGTFDDVEYEVSIPGALTLGMDLHPAGGGFRLSGGVMMQDDDLAIEGTPSGTVEIGNQSFPASGVGTLRGDVSSADVAPFVTLGFGKHGQPGLGLFLDLGVAFLGDPDVALFADGELAGDPAFQAALEAEEERVQDDMDAYGRFYPIVNVGLRIGVGGG